jgi:hypothetical protein
MGNYELPGENNIYGAVLIISFGVASPCVRDIDGMSKSGELTPIHGLIRMDDFDSGETSTETEEMKENAGSLCLVRSEWSKLRGPPPSMMVVYKSKQDQRK